MNWNKEKLVCGAAGVILLGVLVFVVGLGSVSSVDYPQLIRDPQPGQFSPLSEESIEWFVPASVASGRDPFLPLSEWKPAYADSLPTPPLSPLTRRVPLPGTLAMAAHARPPREKTPPESEEEEQ